MDADEKRRIIDDAIKNGHPDLNMKGKNVVVVMADGFMKHGLLSDVQTNFIVLKFSDGKEEIISFNAISVIKPNGERR